MEPYKSIDFVKDINDKYSCIEFELEKNFNAM